MDDKNLEVLETQLIQERKTIKIPKRIDGKFYIVVLQSMMCLIILAVVLVIKTFFTDLYKETKNFYIQNIEDTTKIEQITEPENQNENISSNPTLSAQATNSKPEETVVETAAGGPYNSDSINFNEIRKNLITNKFLVPLDDYTLTSSYGYRKDPFTNEYAFHKGLDMAANMGDEIKASLSGTVVIATKDESYGNYIVIEHSNSLKTLYAHSSELLVKQGDTVITGQTIAKIGSTGRSTGPHLHFEVILNDEKVNPLEYIDINEN